MPLDLRQQRKKIEWIVIFHGPEKSGKSTLIRKIHDTVPENQRSRLLTYSGNRAEDLFSEYLAIKLNASADAEVILNLYTFPARTSNQILLSSVDAMIFVADSSSMRLRENVSAYRSFFTSIQPLIRPHAVGIVQYNKRDLGDAMDIPSMEKAINTLNLPYVESSAINGKGIFAALTWIGRLAANQLWRQNSAEANNNRANSLIFSAHDRRQQATRECLVGAAFSNVG